MMRDVIVPITMQDVRLRVGEGKLTPADVLAGVNAELRARVRGIGGSSASSSTEDGGSFASSPNRIVDTPEERKRLARLIWNTFTGRYAGALFDEVAEDTAARTVCQGVADAFFESVEQ